MPEETRSTPELEARILELFRDELGRLTKKSVKGLTVLVQPKADEFPVRMRSSEIWWKVPEFNIEVIGTGPMARTVMRTLRRR